MLSKIKSITHIENVHKYEIDIDSSSISKEIIEFVTSLNIENIEDIDYGEFFAESFDFAYLFNNYTDLYLLYSPITERLTMIIKTDLDIEQLNSLVEKQFKIF